MSVQVNDRVEVQERRLGAIQTQDVAAKLAVDECFVGAFRLITLLACASAAVAGIIAVFTIRNDGLRLLKSSISKAPL